MDRILTLMVASGYDVTVDYTPANGPAQSESDYVATGGIVTLTTGTLSGTVTIEVVGDLIDELDETFDVELANPQHVVVGDGFGVGTIAEDHEPLIGIEDVEVKEGANGLRTPNRPEAVFTLVLSSQADREIRIDYATASETAIIDEDYLTVSGTRSGPSPAIGRWRCRWSAT